MSDDRGADDLIRRLRARATDPERRVDARQSVFMANVRTLDLGGLFSALTSVRADLDRGLAATRAGTIDPGAHARATQIQADMSTPVDAVLPARATQAEFDRAQARMAFVLPAFLRRALIEVADGGFGPGSGLLPVARMADTYFAFRAESPGPRRSHWPERLLPMVERDPAFDCVNAASGEVVAWDPDGLGEFSRDATWQRSFTVVAPSLEVWLEAWVGSRTPAEVQAERLRESQINAAREARAHIATLTPEQRAAMGLPAEGWERVVWGGIGLD
jgi:hypothetical protein